MVNAYLQYLDAPVTNYEDFVALAETDDGGTDAAAERDALGHIVAGGETPGAEWYADTPDAHALAEGVTRALWQALRYDDADRNGRRSARVVHETPRFDDGDGGAPGGFVNVVVDDDHTVHTVRSTPSLMRARSVVGLDAHPAMPLWELNTSPQMTRDAVLNPTERRLWRVIERGLTVVQVGDATRPRSGSKAHEWMNEERVAAVLERVRDSHDDFKTALATKQTEPAIRRLLDEVCDGESVTGDNLMHFGEEKSRNDFAGESAGYVYGCMDPGDGMIIDTLAELGLDATPGLATDDDGEIIRDDDGDPIREKGRTFEGDDAEEAAATLASVRENHVAQAAGRYARDADSDDGATVYLHTDAAPAGFVDVETPGVTWAATSKQRQIIDALGESRAPTARDIAQSDSVDSGKRHVLETLKNLESEGVVERRAAAGDHGADIFRDHGATPAVVDCGAETTSDHTLDDYSWSFALDDRHAGDEPTTDDSPATNGARKGATSQTGLPGDHAPGD
jgi:hypothetical protein